MNPTVLEALMVIHLSRLRISPPPSLPLLHAKDLGTGTSKTPLLFEGLAKGGKDRLHNLPCRFLPVSNEQQDSFRIVDFDWNSFLTETNVN